MGQGCCAEVSPGKSVEDDVPVPVQLVEKVRDEPATVVDTAKLLGTWRTPAGKYTISGGSSPSELSFCEEGEGGSFLTGLLKQQGEWWEADIRNDAAGGDLVGHLRLQPCDYGVRSTFRLKDTFKWDPVGYVATRIES
mmetsp:Transcript_23468/g.67238  ORF Transcript_23468/g.67238 Transcript_23468/m.67238 type:complete len:138 (-) Transcript_23468:126-539(-)